VPEVNGVEGTWIDAHELAAVHGRILHLEPRKR